MLSRTAPLNTELEKSFISIIEGNIFHILYKTNVFLELEDFKEGRALFEKHAAEQPLKLLVEFPDFTSASAEARSFAEKNPINAVAEAIVYSSLAQGILLRFYLLWNKQAHPVRAFKKRSNAVAWLKKTG